MIILTALAVFPAASAASTDPGLLFETAPAGTADHRFSVLVPINAARPFSGIEIEITVSDADFLALNPPAQSDVPPGASMTPFLSPSNYPGGVVNTYKFGFYTGGNTIAKDIELKLEFTYKGEKEQTLTVAKINCSHNPGGGQPSEFIYSVSDYAKVTVARAEPEPEYEPEPGPGRPGSAGGGIITLPTVEIDNEETPLAELRSVAAFINGYPDKTFRGAQNMTREEFINILFKIGNAADLPAADPEKPSFDDVDPQRWSYNAIEWAVSNEIYNAGGSFRPAEIISRAEVAERLAKADKLSDMAENVFSDIDGHPAHDYILIGVHAGIFNGYPDGTFLPDNPIIRYEVVTALIRYLLGGEPTGDMWEDIELSLIDVPRSHWAYKYVALASAGYVELPPAAAEEHAE